SWRTLLRLLLVRPLDGAENHDQALTRPVIAAAKKPRMNVGIEREGPTSGKLFDGLQIGVGDEGLLKDDPEGLRDHVPMVGHAVEAPMLRMIAENVVRQRGALVQRQHAKRYGRPDDDGPAAAPIGLPVVPGFDDL